MGMCSPVGKEQVQCQRQKGGEEEEPSQHHDVALLPAERRNGSMKGWVSNPAKGQRLDVPQGRIRREHGFLQKLSCDARDRDDVDQGEPRVEGKDVGDKCEQVVYETHARRLVQRMVRHLDGECEDAAKVIDEYQPHRSLAEECQGAWDVARAVRQVSYKTADDGKHVEGESSGPPAKRRREVIGTVVVQDNPANSNEAKTLDEG